MEERNLLFDEHTEGGTPDMDFAKKTRNCLANIDQRTVLKRRNKELLIPTTLDVSVNTILTFAPKSLQ